MRLDEYKLGDNYAFHVAFREAQRTTTFFVAPTTFDGASEPTVPVDFLVVHLVQSKDAERDAIKSMVSHFDPKAVIPVQRQAGTKQDP